MYVVIATHDDINIEVVKICESIQDDFNRSLGIFSSQS